MAGKKYKEVVLMEHTKKKRRFTKEQKIIAVMFRKRYGVDFAASVFGVCTNTIYRWGYEIEGENEK